MKNDRYREAKEIYFKYGGNSFFMTREGDYEHYKSFAVPKEVEKEWMREYRDTLFAKLHAETSGDGLTLIISSIISTVSKDSSDVLVTLSEFIQANKESFDFFTSILIAEALLKAVKFYGHEDSVSAATVALSLQILKKLLERPVTIANDYLESQHMAGYDFSKENLEKRIKNTLLEWDQ